jgi:oxaloacetate decarboxylase alpha subunit/pyruvate carboxylase subunit B
MEWSSMAWKPGAELRLTPACVYLNENPFDRLRTLKQAAPKTPQIMLLRGQNIVQYTSFPDDIVEAFVRCMCRNGMDVIRIFDALNDVRQPHHRIQAVRKAGKTRPW